MKIPNIINVAIIGCGKIAEKHATILGSKKLKKLKLVAVCDTKKNKAKKFAKKFNVDFFDNVDNLLKLVKIDLVVICTSSGHHYSNALAISRYKKNLIIEKPICLNLSEAKQIIKKIEKNKNYLFVVMQNRLNPMLKLLKEAINKKLLGKITSISVRVWWCRDQKYYDQAAWRGTWNLDGGIFLNQAIHHIDMMQWLLGPIHSLTAMIKRRLVKIETEDIGFAIFEFKNGILGNIEVSTALRPKNLENSVTILGENGNIKIGGLYMNDLEIYELKNKLMAKSLLKKYKKLNKNNHHLFYEDIQKKLTKTNTNNNQFVDGKEAIKSLEIAKAIYQSVITKKRVFLPANIRTNNQNKKLLSELRK